MTDLPLTAADLAEAQPDDTLDVPAVVDGAIVVLRLPASVIVPAWIAATENTDAR